MKSFCLLAFFSVLLIIGCSEEKESPTNEWKMLGENVNVDNLEKLGDITASISDEILSISGEYGLLILDEDIEDFVFETEFLLGNSGAAGIAFRYNEAKKGNPKYAGYLVNLDHNLNQQNPTGSIFNVARAKWLKSTKKDDWNKIAVSAQGDHLKVMINDSLVVETHNRRSEEGFIGLLANSSSKAQFRNMRIKELEELEYLSPQIEDYMRNNADVKSEYMIKDNNLDNWDQNGEASWGLKDGVIHGYSNEKGGFLVSKKTYRNFYLKLKFKIKHEDNSGIFIRHDPNMPDEISTGNAIECNIYDHDGFLHEYSTGSIAPIARSWSKMIDYDEWNDMEIFAFEDQVCMYVNGIKSSEAHLPQKFNQKGNICIQGGIQVFNGNLPSDIYIKDIAVKDFEGIPFLGH